MKRKLPLLTVLLTMGAVASSGCIVLGGGGEGEGDSDKYPISLPTTGGTDVEKNAVLSGLNKYIITKTGGTTLDHKVVNDMTANKNHEDGGCGYDYVDLYNYINITFKGDPTKYRVDFTWDIPENSTFLRKYDLSAAITRVEFTYPKYNENAVSYSIKLTKAKCGNCETKSGEKLEYKLNLLPDEVHYDDVTISEIYSVSDRPTLTDGQTVEGFSHVNYAKESPYYTTNYQQKYWYVCTWGKIIYSAPDGNFMIIGNGNDFMEIYAGAGTKLISDNFPDIQVGNNVLVYGSLSAYMGNIQVSYVSRILKIADGDTVHTVTTPADAVAYNASLVAQYKVATPTSYPPSYNNFYSSYQVKNGETLMNKMMYVEGKYVAGSLVDEDKNAYTSINNSVHRVTFKMLLDSGEEVIIAYDYHTNRDKNETIGDVNRTKLNAIFSNANKKFKIVGNMRYAVNDKSSNSKSVSNFHGSNGTWQLVPLTAEGITELN